MILYTCEKCHKWQDVSILDGFAAIFEEIGKAIRNPFPVPKDKPVRSMEQLIACPSGCGQMTLVDPEDKIAIFKENKHSKPPVGSWDDWDKWVKDVYALLWEYAAAFPWEHELKDRADLLLEHVPPKKQEEAKQSISKQIEEMHQQVREFVEKEYLGYQVTGVDNHSETKYAKPLGKTAYTLGRNIAEFRVHGVNAEYTKELSCDVMINSEGKMHIKSVTQCGRI